MASDEPSGARPGPVVLRIKLRYDDVEAMVQRFAPNVGKSGLFLPTKSLQAVGAEVKFELRIADDTPVLVGLGRVKEAKAPDPANPKAAFGMAIELMRVTPSSRGVMLKMLERRKQLGLPELAIPFPADIDAARRSEVTVTSVGDTSSGAVPTPSRVPERDSAPILSAPISNTESVPMLTAPRRQTGPIAIAKATSVPALEAEPPRKRRPAVHELIEQASGPIASLAVNVPGLDEDVDVGAVLARARALAGGNLDAELEALRESAAAPIEISIEAASAELAKQLGGAAVRRDRSAGWATPPSTISAPAPVVIDEQPVAQVAEVAPAEPAYSTAATHVDVHEPDAAPEQPQVITEPVPSIEPDESDEPEHEVEPDQIADEIHKLGEEDFEEVEHTQIGAMPIVEDEPDPADLYVPEPAATAELERSLDAAMAQAEAEADQDDLGFSGGYQPPIEIPLTTSGEIPLGSGDFIMPLNAELSAYQEPYQEPYPQAYQAPEHLDDEDDVGNEPVDDFEILAEADAGDADLLSAHGEEEASGQGQIYPDRDPNQQRLEPEPRLSDSDFASRLDLSDEFEAAPEADPPHYDRSFAEIDHSPGELDPRIVSAGHALAAFDDPEERSSFEGAPAYRDPIPDDDGLDPDSQFTVAGDIPADSIDFDPPHSSFEQARAYAAAEPLPAGFPPLDKFDQSDVISNAPAYVDPYVMRAVAPPPAAAGDGYDLETALEALDVDLDDLSMPHAKTEFASQRSAVPIEPEPEPEPIRTPPRQTRAPREGTRPPPIPVRPPPVPTRAPMRTTPPGMPSLRQTGSGQVIAPAPVTPSGRTGLPRATTDDGILIDFDDADDD